MTLTIEPTPPGELSAEVVAQDLDFPVSIAFADDGRLFYNERWTGRIMVIDPPWSSAPQLFHQLSDVSASRPEKGLMGLALDPEFDRNGHLYVYYTATDDTSKLVRVTELSSNVGGNPSVLLGDLPMNLAHNGGILRFGPDDKLYVSVGEAGVDTGSQDQTILNGKILRLNTDGSAPTDNPFHDGAGANADEVFAMGVKNAFGMAFHGHTGDLWTTDNGSGAQDEVNLTPAGGNLGWPYVQGYCDDVRDNNYAIDETDYCDSHTITEPIHEMSPSVAPTGVVVVGEDSIYPDSYHNNVWYLEYVSGMLKQLRLTGEFDQLGGIESIAPVSGGLDIVQAPDGYIYVSGCGGGQESCSGRIYRIILGE